MPVDTVTVRKRSVHGTMREVIADIGLDASYATGGEALSAANLNALMPEFGGNLLATDSGKIDYFQSERSATGTQLVLDRANNKILAFAAGAEATAASGQAGVVRCRLAYDVGTGLG